MMSEPFLLSRALLQFDSDDDDLLNELSAAAWTADGHLWVSSDEYLSIERLTDLGGMVYGEHTAFAVGDLLTLQNAEDEIDIEGMSYSAPYLWFTGSHSYKRSKPKGKDFQRLAQIKCDANRFTLGRIPLLGGALHRTCSHPDHPDQVIHGACLSASSSGNALTEALKGDEHIGQIVASQLPSKDNGLDIEGLVVGPVDPDSPGVQRVLLGLRGPVLRGWAMLIDIVVEELTPGELSLRPVAEDGRPYRKHFLNLNGLGIRELCLRGDDLIVLGGPTMALEGEMRLFRIPDIFERTTDSLLDQPDEIEVLFDLPFTVGSDHAEGLALVPCLGDPEALMIIYDSPNSVRRVAANAILMDVFRLSQ
ncbi:MAG: DUF3616 domain-containing protein [Cyanobacteria bacterium P01_A01_bin.135]